MSERGERLVERMGASQGSVEADEANPVSAEELALIEKRVREHEANPDDVVPWETLKQELWPDLDGKS